MARKEFTYRGMRIDQLQRLSVEEFARLIPSRERRSLLRGFTQAEKNLLSKLQKRNSVKTHAREMVIIPAMVGKTVLVHTGKEYVPVEINEEMVGIRLGQFVLTRKIAKHASPGVMGKKATAAAGKVSVK